MRISDWSQTCALPIYLARFFLEGRLFRRPIDRDQRGFKRQIDAVAFDIVHQRRDIFLDPEQHTAVIMKRDVDSAEHAPAPPMASGQASGRESVMSSGSIQVDSTNVKKKK